MHLRDRDGNYTPLAYVLLGLLTLVTVGVLALLTNTVAWDTPFETNPVKIG